MRFTLNIGQANDVNFRPGPAGDAVVLLRPPLENEGRTQGEYELNTS
jgi:hypothetical protein